MRIEKDNTIAVLIDLQTKLFPHIYDNESLEKYTIKLIEGIKALSMPLIVTEQYRKGIGPTIQSAADALGESFEPLEKMSFSCCHDDKFMEALKRHNKKNVIVFGIESHVCVLQTVIDLLGNNYQPIVIEDCVSSRRLSDKNTAIARMRQEGAVISSYESILFELLKYSGTDEFRAISKIVK